MVRKKNKMFVDSADRTPHYSLRKLSVGVASVLLSTTLWMGANGSVAHADTINDATVAGKVEDKLDPSETHKDQTQAQNGQGQDAASVVTGANQTKNKEGSSANAEAQTPTANDAHAQADVAKQEPAAQSQQTAPQAQVPAPAERRQASTAEQAAGQASAAATENAKNESTTTLGVSQAFKPSTVAALNKKMVMASLAGTASAGSESKSDDLKSYETTITSLTNRAAQDELNVTLEDPKTYTIKKEALDDLDKQVAGIQGKVTKYEADKAAYDAAKKVYDEDLKKWSDAQNSNDPHMVKGISQGLTFANEHDASLDVTSGSDKPVNFIKSSAWLGKNGEGVYADGITTGGNISKSFSDSDISHDQGERTGKDIKDWGNTYTGVQLHVGESAVARYTGLKNSVYIDKHNVLHKLSKAKVKYTLNETTANDGTANIFLSNSPNIALWYGAAGSQINGRNRRDGRVDLTVDLTFYDENGNPITMDKDSHAWLDMSSLNNGTTKIEYFDPNGNTTKQIPGSTITNYQHDDGRWYADNNNEIKPAPAGWDNPTSADRYYGAAIMELEGNSFHIGQKIIKYYPGLTNSQNVYSWFALDSLLATAYKPVKPKVPDKPSITWHEVTYEPQKATVTYIDDTDNKRTLSSESLEGDSKSVAVVSKDGTPYTTTSSIQDYEKKGYELVSDSTHGDYVVFDNNSSVDQRYEVHLKHGTVTVTPYDKTPVKPGDKINPNDPNSPKYKDDVKHDNLVKDAKQTVHYEGAGTDTPADSVTTQKDAFTRTVKYDKVTGESTTSDWSQPNATFDKVDTPVVKGYTADKKQAGGLTATPDDPEVKDTVVYTPNGSIVPVDPDGNPIPNTPSVPYETDPKDPTKVVDGKVPEVPSWTPKKGKPGDPVVPTDPSKDTKVPYDHTKTPGTVKSEGKQTVTYVYEDKDGKVVKTKKVEEDTTFTGKTTKDEVTGKTTTTWDQKDHKYTAVTTPVEQGYTADKKSVGGETVTPDDPNRSYTVVYTPNGSIVPVDPDGNPIPNTPSVPYETDPKDPTKVVDGKVPEVPSWTPKKGKPGDPVVPTDPSKDTKVPYDHTKVVDDKVPEVPSWTPKNGKPGDPVKPSDPTKDTEVPYDHTITPGKTTTTGKVEGLPEKPAKSAKAPAEKLVKTTVKAPKAVKTAEPAKTISIKESAQAQDQLPQTGEDNSKAAFGLGLASILGGIGILGAFKRKKKEN